MDWQMIGDSASSSEMNAGRNSSGLDLCFQRDPKAAKPFKTLRSLWEDNTDSKEARIDLKEDSAVLFNEEAINLGSDGIPLCNLGKKFRNLQANKKKI